MFAGIADKITPRQPRLRCPVASLSEHLVVAGPPSGSFAAIHVNLASSCDFHGVPASTSNYTPMPFPYLPQSQYDHGHVMSTTIKPHRTDSAPILPSYKSSPTNSPTPLVPIKSTFHKLTSTTANIHISTEDKCLQRFTST